MAVTYERVVGRRMKVVRSKQSARLEASRRWRRVEEQPAEQPAEGQRQVTDGVPPSMGEVPTKPKPDVDAGEVDGQSDEQGSGEAAEPESGKQSRSRTKTTSAGQSGKTTQEEG